MNALPLALRSSLPICADDLAAVKLSRAKLRSLGARTIHPALGRPFPIGALDRQVA
jgi:hypothetical protein